MNAKLTLKLDQDVIRQAKLYSRDKRQSLSTLVENYFRFLIGGARESEEPDISPTVKELSGIIDLDSESNRHDEYTDYLLEKYS